MIDGTAYKEYVSDLLSKIFKVSSTATGDETFRCQTSRVRPAVDLVSCSWISAAAAVRACTLLGLRVWRMACMVLSVWCMVLIDLPGVVAVGLRRITYLLDKASNGESPLSRYSQHQSLGLSLSLNHNQSQNQNQNQS